MSNQNNLSTLFKQAAKNRGIEMNITIRLVQNKTALLCFEALSLPLRFSNALVLLNYEIKTEMKKCTDWGNILD